MAGEVHAIPDETHSLGAKTPPLDFSSGTGARRDAPAVAHNAVPGNLGAESIRKGAEGPTDGPGPAGYPQEPCDLSIGRDSPTRDRGHEDVDSLEERSSDRQGCALSLARTSASRRGSLPLRAGPRAPARPGVSC